MRALFLLPTVKEAMETALALDPGYAPTYSLAGSIYYEVPGFGGGGATSAGPGPCSEGVWSSARPPRPCASASRAPSQRGPDPPAPGPASKRGSPKGPRTA